MSSKAFKLLLVLALLISVQQVLAVSTTQLLTPQKYQHVLKRGEREVFKLDKSNYVQKIFLGAFIQHGPVELDIYADGKRFGTLKLPLVSGDPSIEINQQIEAIEIVLAVGESVSLQGILVTFDSERSIQNPKQSAQTTPAPQNQGAIVVKKDQERKDTEKKDLVKKVDDSELVKALKDYLGYFKRRSIRSNLDDISSYLDPEQNAALMDPVRNTFESLEYALSHNESAESVQNKYKELMAAVEKLNPEAERLSYVSSSKQRAIGNQFSEWSKSLALLKSK